MFFKKLDLLSFGEQKIALTISYLNQQKLAYYSNNIIQADKKTLPPRNMKRNLLSVAVAMIIMSNVNAQVTYGIQAGATIANWQGDALQSLNNVVDLSNGFISTKSKTGIMLGGYVNIPVSDRLSFEPGIQYAQKGYALQGDLKIDALKFLGVNASAKVESHYIDVPLVLNAEVVKGLHIYAGPQISYLAKSNLHVNTSVLGFSLINKKIDLTDNFNRVDMGIIGGVGYSFDNGLNIKAGYDYGLAKLDKNDNFKAYNRAVKISVGYSF